MATITPTGKLRRPILLLTLLGHAGTLFHVIKP